VQGALKRKVSKRASKLILLPLNQGEVGLNGCSAWKHDGKAANEVAQKREILSEQMSSVVIR
jgi:hypothetical protein